MASMSRAARLVNQIGTKTSLTSVSPLPKRKGTDIVYVGAGHNLLAALDMDEGKRAVYIDPGKVELIHPQRIFGGNLYQFRDTVRKEARKHKMLIGEISRNEIDLRKDHMDITYLMGYSIPDDLERVAAYIQDFEQLIVIGDDLSSDIMNYTSKKVRLWGNLETTYTPKADTESISDSERNSVIYRLNNEIAFRNRFNNFNLITNAGNAMTFSHWSLFVNYTKDVAAAKIKAES